MLKARDALLYFEFVEPISVVVIHAMAESASDGWADLMTDNPHIHTGYKLEGMPKRDKEHVNVLITGKTIRHAEDVYNYKLNTSTFLAVLRLHMAVFMGKLNMPYARNENFFLVFPEGLRNTGLCYVLSTFTTDARAVANRPLTSISPRIRMISELEFELKSDGSTSEYYWFVGTFTEQGSRIRLEMHGPSGVAAVISLERQLKSTA